MADTNLKEMPTPTANRLRIQAWASAAMIRRVADLGNPGSEILYAHADKLEDAAILDFHDGPVLIQTFAKAA